MAFRSSTDLARRSIDATTTLSPSRAYRISSVSNGRSLLAPDGFSSNNLSTCPIDSICRSRIFPALDTRAYPITCPLCCTMSKPSHTTDTYRAVWTLLRQIFDVALGYTCETDAPQKV